MLLLLQPLLPPVCLQPQPLSDNRRCITYSLLKTSYSRIRFGDDLGNRRLRFEALRVRYR
jgi:hypothetical protein